MAVRIRLTRKGKKHQPTYRVVVADSRSPRDGRFIEQIGRYDPRQEPSLVEIDAERAAYWLANGARPSSQVRKLLEIAGALPARPGKAAKVHVVGEEAQRRAEAEAGAEADTGAIADGVEAIGVDEETAAGVEEAAPAPSEEVTVDAASDEATDEGGEEERS
jgi:small subunit ribosomal protein S16